MAIDDGGAYKGSLNLKTTQEVEKEFILTPIPLGEKVCIVFHCEFSSHRGPVLYGHISPFRSPVTHSPSYA